ncbi:serine/threonineprotein kinase [Achlya hypogyna]|uniref:Serine/threonineprotein kinase n=1 Tax=Achlya hypogyna TaxID=1202772 RepID=A0A1V9YF17_ACHHY|nr:serine/threonineprotein kinase [Achlya hypogyna]
MELTVKVIGARDLKSPHYFHSIKHAYARIRYATDTKRSETDHFGKHAPSWNLEMHCAEVNSRRYPYVQIELYDEDPIGQKDAAIGYCRLEVPSAPERSQQWRPLLLADKVVGYVCILVDCIAKRQRRHTHDRPGPDIRKTPMRLSNTPDSTSSSEGRHPNCPTPTRSRRASSLSPEFLRHTESLPGSIPRIEPDEVREMGTLGRGAYGTVAKGMYRDRRVAIKTFHLNHTSADGTNESFEKEVAVMSKLQSHYTVALLGISHNAHDQPQIVMEFMAGGSLHEHLKRLSKETAPTLSLVPIALGVAKGLAYLHKHGIIHRDLKPANVLLDASYERVKLGDFGISREDALATMTNGIGTTPWMAPEVIASGKYSVPADIYALGVLLTQLDTLNAPYANEKCNPLLLQAKILDGLRPSLRADCPEWYQQLAVACMQHDPSVRPTAADVVAALEGHMALPASSPMACAALPTLEPADVVIVGIENTSNNGIVSRGIYADQIVAVKRFVAMSPRDIKDSVTRMARLASEYTVKLLGTVGEELVMEYMAGGNLTQFITRQRKRAWPSNDLRNVLDVALALARAVTYLHAHDVAHGNLVPTNVLLDKKCKVKLSDFALDRDDDAASTNGAQASLWRAPEVLRGQDPSLSADIFALGVLFAQLETLEEPYSNVRCSLAERMAQVACGKLRLSLSPSCPTWFRQVVMDCTAYDPKKRPSASDVVQIMQENMAKDLKSLDALRSVVHPYVFIRYGGHTKKSWVHKKGKDSPHWDVEARFLGVDYVRHPNISLEVYDEDPWGRGDMFIGACAVQAPVDTMAFERWLPLWHGGTPTGTILVHCDSRDTLDCSNYVRPSISLSASRRESIFDADVTDSVRKHRSFSTATTTNGGSFDDADNHHFLRAAGSSGSLAASELLEVDTEDLVLTIPLGTGMFGSVAQGVYRGTDVAIKTYHLTASAAFDTALRLYSTLQSKHVVRVLGVGRTRWGQPQLVMELASGGNLHQFIDRCYQAACTSRLAQRVLPVACQLAMSTAYLHGHDVVHGDLRPPNVLLDGDDCVKLSDFGMPPTGGGDGIALYWTAPEVLMHTKSTAAADVYALGVILTEIETLQRPFSDFRGVRLRLLAHVCDGTIRPTMSYLCPSWYKQLATDCMASDPSLRPSAAYVASTLTLHADAFN